MKYLSKFNESSSDEFASNFNQTLLKDIIITIRDDYPKIEGTISYTKDRNLILSLNCKPHYDESILGKVEYDTTYLDKKNDFLIKIVDTLHRIEEAMNCKVTVFDLYRFDEPSSDGIINIYILSK